MSEMTISLTMIVKNEASRLAACLESAQGFVDEIVIVDTGSTDNTMQVARQYTDKVFSYAWQHDFSAARNYALSQASGDWILYLDADEKLVCADCTLKDLIVKDKNIEAYMLPLEHPINESTGEFNNFLVLRLFKNNNEYYFTGRIHEQVVVKNRQVVGVAEGVKIKHALLSPKERNLKKGRNLRFLKAEIKDEPENPFLCYYLGVEWLGLGKPKLALPLLEKAYSKLTDDFIMFKSAALRYLLTCLNLLQEFERVICLGQEAALHYVNYADVYYLTGCALEEKAEYKIALKWFHKAIESGTPAVTFSHLQGTEGFLAYYHLGFCYEKLNQKQQAEQCYEQALRENNQYHYPSCSLFMVKMARCGCSGVLQYFEDKNYFANYKVALTVADLFYQMGSPGYAKRCLLMAKGLNPPAWEYMYYLGKYHILSGEIGPGLEYLKQLPVDSAFYVDSKIYFMLGLILQGNYAAVRAQSLELWQHKELRIIARFFNSLSHWLPKGLPPYINFEQLETKTFYLKLLNICHRYLPDFPKEKDIFQQRLLTMLQDILLVLPGGRRLMDDYYAERINEISKYVSYRF